MRRNVCSEGKITERGATLLEVLIAVVVLSIGILGLTGMQIAAIRGNVFGIEITQAAIVAQDKIEELTNMTFAAMAGGNDTATKAGVDFARTWTVTAAGNMSTIQVVVVWTDKSGDARTVTLTTLRAKL